ncbi:hypothetical protein BTO15_10560 [Polaribacter sejongensis]|uniref:Uncharacterized protein n=1 Tax=Polaribacter sejongensis TaxID=985043 RepID=A0ABM6Q0B7_9FLAO|nr:hypothetical protein BTO15_10560 [Polaribacter sejongensis]
MWCLISLLIITPRFTEKTQRFTEKTKKDTNFTDFTDDSGVDYYTETHREDTEFHREIKKTRISRILLMIVG